MNLLQKQRAETVVKAHVRWFQDVRNAVETGRSDVAPATAAADTECEFGKWVQTELRGLCSPELFDDIRQIHADFHRAAAAILALAVAGNEEEARARLGRNSDLVKLSKRLIEKVHELR